MSGKVDVSRNSILINKNINYKRKYNFNLLCELCKSQISDQKHLLQCSVLTQRIPELKNNTTVKYVHIFGDIEKMVPAIKLLSKVVKIREELIDELEL